jgi:hypothetical protein
LNVKLIIKVEKVHTQKIYTFEKKQNITFMVRLNWQIKISASVQNTLYYLEKKM